MIIRPLVKSDRLQMLSISKEFFNITCADLGYHFNEDKANRLIDMALENKIKCFVVEVNGEIVGLSALIIADSLFSDEKIAQEVLWYVKPSHRSGMTGIRLYKRLLQCARESEVDFLIMSTTRNIDEYRVSAFYKKDGFKYTDSNYLKRIR